MIDNNAQFVVEMQQSQSQANRTKTFQTVTPSDQSFSGYLDESQKSYKDNNKTSDNGSRSQDNNSNRAPEQQAQSAVARKPESRITKPVENKDSNKISETAETTKITEATETSETTETNESRTKHIESESSQPISTSETEKGSDELIKEAIAEIVEETGAVKETDIVLKDVVDNETESSLSDLIKLIIQRDSNLKLDNPTEIDSEVTGGNEKLTAAQIVSQRAINEKPINFQDAADSKKLTEELAAKIVGQKTHVDQAVNKLVDDKPEPEDAQIRLLPDLVKRILNEKEPQAVEEGKQNKLHAIANVLNANIKQGSLNEVKLDNISTMLGLEEGDLTTDMDTEALFAKLVERLDFNKTNGEALLQHKITGNKNSMMSDFVDQLTTKSNTESLDRTSMMSSLSSTARTTTTALATPQQMTLQTQINNPEWGSDFSKRIQFLVKNNMQHAELRLDPPDMGKIHVRINLSQDQASVSFASGHSNVRDAIEQAMPRLRELLNESGIQLGNTDVASQFQQKNENHAGQDPKSSNPAHTTDYDEEMESELIQHAAMEYSVDGMIDYFA